MLGHGLVKIDSSNQVVVKVAARVGNTLTHSFKTREMDHSIKPVNLTKETEIKTLKKIQESYELYNSPESIFANSEARTIPLFGEEFLNIPFVS